MFNPSTQGTGVYNANPSYYRWFNDYI